MNEKIQVGELKVNYQIAGSGEPVMILHGWGSRAKIWTEVQKRIADARFKVVVPDLIGFGESSLPLTGWRVDDYVNWLSSFILELSKKHPEFSKEIVFIGHSFGGRILVKAAARKILPMKALILCGAAGLKSDAGLKLKVISDLAKSGAKLMDRMRLRRLKGPFRDFYYRLLRQNDYLRVSKTMRDTFRMVVEEDLTDCLDDIEARTLIVWGQNDRVVPMRQAHRFHQGIRHSNIKIMSGVGHSPQIEQPENLSVILIEFLRSH